VEAVESTTPVIVERFELIPDSGGRGRFRGGLGVRRDVRILGESIKFTNLSERHRFRPFGVLGGEPGQLGRTVVNPDSPGAYEIGGKASVDLEFGDVVSFQLAGAGGYGNPAERDPQGDRGGHPAGPGDGDGDPDRASHPDRHRQAGP